MSWRYFAIYNEHYEQYIQKINATEFIMVSFGPQVLIEDETEAFMFAKVVKDGKAIRINPRRNPLILLNQELVVKTFDIKERYSELV